MKKTAIIYDWIDKWGGVERVLLALHKIYPEAVFFASVYDPKKATWAKNLEIKTTYIQTLPDFIKKSRILSLPFYATAFENLDLTKYDLVISVSSSFSKSVITQPRTRHVCYLLTPTRFLWSHRRSYYKNNFISKSFAGYLKYWDLAVSRRPDEIISISETVKKRCKKYYRLDSRVIYPPFDTKYWRSIKPELPASLNLHKPYFLVVSRLEPYKNVDLVVKAFRKINERLIVVGEGSMENKLREMAGDNVQFLSKITDSQLAGLYGNALALIMPQEEDFGYVSLESQFFGTPVIALKRGGATETIIEGETGIFFEGASVVSLRQAIERFKRIKYNLKSSTGRIGPKAVLRFDEKKFSDEFTKITK